MIGGVNNNGCGQRKMSTKLIRDLNAGGIIIQMLVKKAEIGLKPLLQRGQYLSRL